MRRGGEEQSLKDGANGGSGSVAWRLVCRAPVSSPPTAESGLPTRLRLGWFGNPNPLAGTPPNCLPTRDGAVGVERQIDRERHSRMAPTVWLARSGSLPWRPAPIHGAGGALPSASSDGAGVEGLVLLHAVQAYQSNQQPGSMAGSSAPALAQSSAGATGRPRDAGRGAACFQPEASGSWAVRERTQRV